MEYSFFGETIEFELHDKPELFSDLIRQYGCAGDMEDILAYKHILKPHDIAIDVGANIGWNTCFLAKFLKGTGHVYAFEPDDDNYALLCKNIQNNNLTNVTPIKLALSDATYQGKFYHSETNFGNHLLEPVMINTQEHNRYGMVEVTTFDEILTKINIDPTKISLIKLDIQGHEPHFFNGAKQFFKTHRPTMVMEYAPFHIKQCGGSPFDVFGFIDRNNYSISIIERIEDLSNPKYETRKVSMFSVIEHSPRFYENMMHQDLLLQYEGQHGT